MSNVLSWPKSLGFSIPSYGKIQATFLANSVIYSTLTQNRSFPWSGPLGCKLQPRDQIWLIVCSWHTQFYKNKALLNWKKKKIRGSFQLQQLSWAVMLEAETCKSWTVSYLTLYRSLMSVPDLDLAFVVWITCRSFQNGLGSPLSYMWCVFCGHLPKT